MKILTIVGARPQFIKAAALSKKISEKDNITEVIIHTGQHFDANMSAVFFEEMGLPKPTYLFDIHGLNHGAMTGRMLSELEPVLIKEQPDVVLVYGDTNSTLAGALAAKKLNFKLAHVEAGLRSYNNRMPEEINRILTDRISDYLFCPTDTAMANLKKEGFDNFDCRIFNSGDIMYDSMKLFTPFAKNHRKSDHSAPMEYVLCTIHRAENTDDTTRLAGILKAINTISQSIAVILPLHPRTRQKIRSGDLAKNVRVIDPVGYLEMLDLLANCELVMTDSGGLQKEAFLSNKFCITLRDETEWTELSDNNYNVLCGSDAKKIEEAYTLLHKKTFISKHRFYGDGNASEIILSALQNTLGTVHSN